jgi:peptidoglycan hydrolase-like protein with peptidoglycan-binding domain
MRNGLRRIAFGVLGTGMIVAMTAGSSAVAANASVAAPQHTATAAKAQWQSLSWPAVRQTAYGNRVRTIQYLLNQRGFRAPINSYFGPSTTFAVKAFQRSRGLYPDGIVGNATWPKLVVTVRRGSRGYAVSAVQSYLVRGYHYRLVVDGVFGRGTEKAVRWFQLRYRLRPDGVVGVTTWNALVRNAL